MQQRRRQVSRARCPLARQACFVRLLPRAFKFRARGIVRLTVTLRVAFFIFSDSEPPLAGTYCPVGSGWPVSCPTGQYSLGSTTTCSPCGKILSVTVPALHAVNASIARRLSWYTYCCCRLCNWLEQLRGRTVRRLDSRTRPALPCARLVSGKAILAQVSRCLLVESRRIPLTFLRSSCLCPW